MSKRKVEVQGGREDKFKGDGSEANVTMDSTRKATAAQLASRKIKSTRGSRRGPSPSPGHGFTSGGQTASHGPFSTVNSSTLNSQIPPNPPSPTKSDSGSASFSFGQLQGGAPSTENSFSFGQSTSQQASKPSTTSTSTSTSTSTASPFAFGSQPSSAPSNPPASAFSFAGGNAVMNNPFSNANGSGNAKGNASNNTYNGTMFNFVEPSSAANPANSAFSSQPNNPFAALSGQPKPSQAFGNSSATSFGNQNKQTKPTSVFDAPSSSSQPAKSHTNIFGALSGAQPNQGSNLFAGASTPGRLDDQDTSMLSASPDNSPQAQKVAAPTSEPSNPFASTTEASQDSDYVDPLDALAAQGRKDTELELARAKKESVRESWEQPLLYASDQMVKDHEAQWTEAAKRIPYPRPIKTPSAFKPRVPDKPVSPTKDISNPFANPTSPHPTQASSDGAVTAAAQSPAKAAPAATQSPAKNLFASAQAPTQPPAGPAQSPGKPLFAAAPTPAQPSAAPTQSHQKPPLATGQTFAQPSASAAQSLNKMGTGFAQSSAPSQKESVSSASTSKMDAIAHFTPAQKQQFLQARALMALDAGFKRKIASINHTSDVAALVNFYVEKRAEISENAIVGAKRSNETSNASESTSKKSRPATEGAQVPSGPSTIASNNVQASSIPGNGDGKRKLDQEFTADANDGKTLNKKTKSSDGQVNYPNLNGASTPSQTSAIFAGIIEKANQERSTSPAKPTTNIFASAASPSKPASTSSAPSNIFASASSSKPASTASAPSNTFGATPAGKKPKSSSLFQGFGAHQANGVNSTSASQAPAAANPPSNTFGQSASNATGASSMFTNAQTIPAPIPAKSSETKAAPSNPFGKPATSGFSLIPKGSDGSDQGKTPGFSFSGFGGAAVAKTDATYFKELAKKSEDHAKKLRKAEEFDSDDETEEEWERRDAEKQAAKKKEFEAQGKQGSAKYVPGKGFIVSTSGSDDSAASSTTSANSSQPEATKSAASNGSSLFASKPNFASSSSSPSPSTAGGASVFDSPAPMPKHNPFATNIFGHLSDADSGTDKGKGKAKASNRHHDSESESDEDEEPPVKIQAPKSNGVQDKDQDKDQDGGSSSDETFEEHIRRRRKAKTLFGKPKASEPEDSSTSSNGGLFGRISRPEGDARPLPNAEAQSNSSLNAPSNAPSTSNGVSSSFGASNNSQIFGSSASPAPTTGFSIFGASAQSKAAGDKTWTPSSPIKFGASTTANASSDPPSKTVNGDENKSPAKPASAIFGTKDNEKSSSGSNNFPKPNDFGFGFGGPSKFGSSSLSVPSNTTSNETSRATSPGATTDTGADTADDAGAQKDEQLDLTSKGPGEEDEEVIFLTRAKASILKPGAKEPIVRGTGTMRILKNKETGKVRILLRQQPTGKVVLNTAVIPGVTYKVRGEKYVSVPAPTEDGTLESWLLLVKDSSIAMETVKHLEQQQSALKA
ncbi:MAG: hypothetical protein M4579_001089 [Chaenotheca gracillima]|nr:MAG: hypothetical protein M4579_001089 [Chaenotheca gracillima]